MNNGFRRVITIVLSAALFMTLFLTVPVDGKVAYAVEEVTIVGTIQNTRSYYNVNGDVNAYCFFPSTLSTYKVGKKQVEITEFGVGVDPEKFGTNDLSSFVGVTKAYTGVIAKSSSAPFTYTFVVYSATDTAAPTMTEMDTYLKGLGFSTTPTDMQNGGEYFIGCLGWNNTVTFSYHMKGSCAGEITAYILHEDFSPDFGIDTFRIASNAKAMQVARKMAQYGNGEVTRDELSKYLNSL